jgi:carbamoyltransferase
MGHPAWIGEARRSRWEYPFPCQLSIRRSPLQARNSGEYKMMGLAPYGEPRYADTIRQHLVDVKPDGTFRLDMRYFDYAAGLRMTNARFDALFGGPARKPDAPVDQRTMDVAASIQQVTDEIQVGRTSGARSAPSVPPGSRSTAFRMALQGGGTSTMDQPARGGRRARAALVAWHQQGGFRSCGPPS